MRDTGAARIVQERNRQILDEKFTSDHDDEYTHGELARAAICYAAPRPVFIRNDFATGLEFIDPWPWSPAWDKRLKYGERRKNPSNTPSSPSSMSLTERIDLLTKSGALIAAEIDRLLRIKERISNGS